ncbi:MAG: serine protease, partial [Opitutaceae bacterium]
KFDPTTGAFSATSVSTGSDAGPGKGVAVAIDRRGYFLTNSHVVAKPPLYVLFRGEKRMHMEEAQVVWRTDLAKNEPDLALLYVPAALHYAFEWAPLPQMSDKILGVGPKEPLGYQFTLFGGQVLTAEKRQRGLLPAWHEVKHSAPFRPGDSGGPLVNVRGQLVAINALGDYDIHFFRSWNPFRLSREFVGGRSFRPDVGWIEQMIEADAKKRAGTQRGL